MTNADEPFHDPHDRGGCLRSPILWLAALVGFVFGLLRVFGK